MQKHKKFLPFLLVLPLFGVFSCAKAKEDYPIRRFTKEKDIVKQHLVVEGNLTKVEYEAKNDETLDLSGLTIKIDSQDVTNNRINERNENKELIKENYYFVCSNEEIPTNSFVGNEYKASTNVESMDFTFYIATAIRVNDSYEIYVSQSYKVTIKNSGAIKPWVWYVVTGVVIFGVIGMVMFTRHYKAKKEDKI